MTVKLRRHLSGEFVAQRLHDGAWRLSRAEYPPIDIWLRSAADAADAAGSPSATVAAGLAGLLDGTLVTDVDLEWDSDLHTVRLNSAGCTHTLKTRNLILHEPQSHLYDTLALPLFDTRARRFWRNVFRLVRLPGGRHLLNLLARSR